MEIKKIFAYPQLMYGYICSWLTIIVFAVIGMVCFNATDEWLVIFPVFVVIAMTLFTIFNFFSFSKMMKRLRLSSVGIKYNRGKQEIVWREITKIEKESVVISALSKIPYNSLEKKIKKLAPAQSKYAHMFTFTISVASIFGFL
ncbi:MAG: hypothetical protein IJ309_07585 [Clostridia bacterium]|nr:hypothetical protein [Clostridia bacterium]MBQ7907812.1 hypothetical protein [Clostridia bacterium]